MTFLKCSIRGVKYGETAIDEAPMEQEVATGRISRGPSPAPDALEDAQPEPGNLQDSVKDLFKWNTHTDLTNFTFLDENFVQKCRNGEPVSKHSA
jgi:hypothetical protein